MVLHNAGACHTEIVGLAESGDFLIVKQPVCLPFREFETDPEALLQEQPFAASRMKAVTAKGISARGFWIFWNNGMPWCLGDLHKGNIMRDTTTLRPTVIDALIGSIPPNLLRQMPVLSQTVERAREWAETGILSDDNPFKGIRDEDL